MPNAEVSKPVKVTIYKLEVANCDFKIPYGQLESYSW